MLFHLSISQFALIETLDLEVKDGLLVFTGETGAGKSIVLDAIGLLLGERASTEMIRRGSDQAVIEALFDISTIKGKITEWLHEYDLPLDDEDTLVVSRQLYRSGRSVCRIQGHVVTVQMLKSLGQFLVEQQGQHDVVGLTNPDEQRRIVDTYGMHGDLLRDVEAAYVNWKTERDRLNAARMDEQERMRRLDMLQFQLQDIDEARPVPGEVDELQTERKRLQHMDKISSSIESAVSVLGGGDFSEGVVSSLVQVKNEIAVAAELEEHLGEALELLDSAHVHAEEALFRLERVMTGLDMDPERLQTIEDRLVALRSLCRKYGPTIEDVVAHEQKAQDELRMLENHEQEITELEKQLERTAEQYQKTALRLSAARRETAGKLAKEIKSILIELNMPDAELEISIQMTGDHAKTFSPHGADRLEFLFSANRGEELLPLARIASGGELSRTLLALHVVLADVEDTETLIFDEIDTGVSGDAAQRIAQLMRRLGQHRQVICVTHSAQIAAAGNTHYKITKATSDERTRTEVEILTEDERVSEVARLLGATSSNETAATHALALLGSFREAFTQNASAGSFFA